MKMINMIKLAGNGLFLAMIQSCSTSGDQRISTGGYPT